MFSFSVELPLICLLVLANSLLAMAETAVVASRKSLLERESLDGGQAATSVLALVQNPTRFHGLVQFWLTLSGTAVGVIGGLRFAEPLAAKLALLPIAEPWAYLIGLIIVTLGLAGFLLLFGELVPKRIGLAYPEAVAKQLASTIRALAWLAAPILMLFERAADALVHIFHLKPRSLAADVGDDEVRALVEQGLHAGVFQRVEKEMVESVLQLDDRPITELMTPRPKIVFLNLDDPQETNWRKIVTSGHSYFPVYQSTRDQVVGLVSVKSLWAHSAIGVPTSLKNLLVEPLTVNDSLTAIQLLEQFKKTGKHIAVVTDEFGSVQGLVTLIDVLEAIVGDLPDMGPQREPPTAFHREDGSWLMDATLAVSEFKEHLGIETDLPHEEDADFQTLGGFMITQFGRIPKAGDRFDWDRYRFEIIDMDRRRVDKVLVTPLTPATEDASQTSA